MDCAASRAPNCRSRSVAAVVARSPAAERPTAAGLEPRERQHEERRAAGARPRREEQQERKGPSPPALFRRVPSVQSAFVGVASAFRLYRSRKAVTDSRT